MRRLLPVLVFLVSVWVVPAEAVTNGRLGTTSVGSVRIRVMITPRPYTSSGPGKVCDRSIDSAAFDVVTPPDIVAIADGSCMYLNTKQESTGGVLLLVSPR
jgi:hypothetical protein